MELGHRRPFAETFEALNLVALGRAILAVLAILLLTLASRLSFENAINNGELRPPEPVDYELVWRD